ncbi:RNA-directed DNA polymerase [Pseudanabaena sp. FACHB-723]|uniref:RNA-directed DNA polymerase n=2 Tax=Pseudanabaena mucicola TaxID=71190 RepID=A0ABR7ZSX8_9CYAN|nr:RNA-directed DNA polymerase [Pseudanabaena mucicola FACHB-723]
MPQLKNKYSRYDLNQSPFFRLTSQTKLAKVLWISKRKLEILIDSENLYIEDVFIKSGKSRLLAKPRYDLKKVQKQIEDILKRIKCPDYLHSPKKDCSYISNAKVHTNANVVVTLDIQNYFSSTPSRRVYWFFHKKMQCSPDVASILAKLLTFKDHLPTGSPSSPLIAYFAYIDMWNEINELVENANCKLSLYIDDVTISGQNVSEKLIWEVKKKIYSNDLSVNKSKEKRYSGKQPRQITGVILTPQGEMKLPNRQHLKMYKVRKLIKKTDDPEAKDNLTQKLKGLESQAKQIMSSSKT